MGEDLVSGVGGLGVSLWLYRQHRDPTLAKCARVGHPSCPELEQKGQKPGPPADGQSQIFEFKGLTRKILKTKEIGRPDPFPVQPYRYGVANGVLKSTTNLEILRRGFRNEKGDTLSGGGTAPRKPKEGLGGRLESLSCVGSVSSHPCKVRKGGAPILSGIDIERSKPGPPATSEF